MYLCIFVLFMYVFMYFIYDFVTCITQVFETWTKHNSFAAKLLFFSGSNSLMIDETTASKTLRQPKTGKAQQ